MSTQGSRFRFSLRTLFVVVGILCVWLSYELNWIRQRHELLSKHGDLALTVEPMDSFAIGPIDSPFAPGFLWVFGEDPVENLELIFVSDNPKREPTIDEQREIDQARRLFPEANVSWRMAKKLAPDNFHASP